MFSYGVILLFFSHLPNVIQICDIMPCTNACCSIQFLLQKLQTLSVLFHPRSRQIAEIPYYRPLRKDIFTRLQQYYLLEFDRNFKLMLTTTKMLETGTEATGTSHWISPLPETQLAEIQTRAVPKLTKRKQTLY